MAYVIMALDEFGTETRLRSPFDKEFNTPEEARDLFAQAPEHFPEYRSFWIEDIMSKSEWGRILEREEFNEYGGY